MIDVESSSIDYVDSAFDKQSKYNKTTNPTPNSSPPPHSTILAISKTKTSKVLDSSEKLNNSNVILSEADNKLSEDADISGKNSGITFSACETTASGIGLVTNSMKIAKKFEQELNKTKVQPQQPKENVLKIKNNNENTNSSVKEKIMLFSSVASTPNKPPSLSRTQNQRPLSQIITNTSKPRQQSSQNLLKNQNTQFASSYQSIFKSTPYSSTSSSASCNRVDALQKTNNQNLKLNTASSLASSATALPTTTLTSIETTSLINQSTSNRSILTPSNSNHNIKSAEKKNSFKSVKDKIAYFSSNQKVNSPNKSIIGNKNNNISKSIEIISSQVQNAIHTKKTRPKEWDSLKHAYNSNNNENSSENFKSNFFFKSY
jgi:hypothetical protein